MYVQCAIHVDCTKMVIIPLTEHECCYFDTIEHAKLPYVVYLDFNKINVDLHVTYGIKICASVLRW